MPPVEYAPQYSRAERVRLIALGAIIVTPLMCALQFWFFPWLREFSATAACRVVFGTNALELLFYGLFVGLPLQAGLVVLALFGYRGFKVLRQGRVPPQGEKVFRPTPVLRGSRATVIGYLQLFAAAPVFALAVWGASEAGTLIKQAQGLPAHCAPSAPAGGQLPASSHAENPA